MLIRDVAYSGLAKGERARLHRAFADWLAGRPVDERAEAQAHHLDRAAALVAELDGRVPDDLRAEAAAALELAGRRALVREANRTARRLLLRAIELEPSLERRFYAARAAWRLWELPAASVEMEAVRDLAREAGNRTIEGLALTQLAEIVLNRNADVPTARRLGEEALELLADAPGDARYEALTLLSGTGWWEGDLTRVELYTRETLEIAREAERADLEGLALVELAAAHAARLDLAEADELLEQSAALAEASGSISTAAWGARVRGSLNLRRGRFADAAREFGRSSELFAETGNMPDAARTRQLQGIAVWRDGDIERAEQLVREAVRTLLSVQERGKIVEAQRTLAEIVLAQGHVEEAERWALSAVETVGMQDMNSRSNVRMVLGLVRAAQGRDAEAELLLREAVDILAETDFRSSEPEPLAALAAFSASAGATTRRRPLEERLERAASARQRGADHLTRRLVRRLRDDGRGAVEPASASRSGSARSVPSPYGRCFVSFRFAKAMSEKWMWNGAPSARTPSASSSASRNRSASRNAPSLVACMCAKSTTGRTQPTRRLISTHSSSEPKSLTRPMTSIPNGTARPFPSSRSRTSASCSTTAATESSRLRPSRNPGWKTTSSAPHAVAIPALRSSAPSADDHFRPLASRCPTQPKSGACTDSARSCSRASSPSRSAHG